MPNHRKRRNLPKKFQNF